MTALANPSLLATLTLGELANFIRGSMAPSYGHITLIYFI